MQILSIFFLPLSSPHPPHWCVAHIYHTHVLSWHSILSNTLDNKLWLMWDCCFWCVEYVNLIQPASWLWCISIVMDKSLPYLTLTSKYTFFIYETLISNQKHINEMFHNSINQMKSRFNFLQAVCLWANLSPRRSVTLICNLFMPNIAETSRHIIDDYANDANGKQATLA